MARKFFICFGTLPKTNKQAATGRMISKKRASANSNVVTVRVYPVPERISSMSAKVTEPAIELHWDPPIKTSGGEPLSGGLGYRVYRGEVDPSSADAATNDIALTKWKIRPILLGSTDAKAYRDPGFEFGKTYVYFVRSVIPSAGEPIESGDSNPAIVKPVDIFPPAAPNGLAAAVVADGDGKLHVDLSWSINSETDLAGYRVYRSEREDARGGPINPELLLTPAVRDTSVQLGHRYWYVVTAVDRVGNESPPSTPLAVEIAQP